MKKESFIIESNLELSRNCFEMRLRGDGSAFTAPGQFAELEAPGKFLRRPFSAADYDREGFTVLYSLAGGGTRALSALTAGTAVDALTGLGQGYDPALSGPAPLLIGGGTGLSPMYALCRALRAEGRAVTVILGFNDSGEVLYVERFEALGARVIVTTADGSAGMRGFVTDAMSALDYSHVYACGSAAMIKAVADISRTEAQLSMEARMGCGFGVCMGCSIMTRNGAKRVCKDGPVFLRSELIWES